MYDIFYTYFDNPIMTKLRNEDTHSIYVCRIRSLLMNDKRYILAYVPINAYLNGTETRMSNLKWTVLQARKLQESLNLPFHSYNPKQPPPYNTPIHLVSKTDTISLYECQLPIQIHLLADDSIFYDYGVNGAINAALETYNCIVILK
jgi:hypothetical protein